MDVPTVGVEKEFLLVDPSGAQAQPAALAAGGWEAVQDAVTVR
jgi:hypothetical protein